MSNEDGNVSWKLNDLIHASRRAAYRRYESLEHSDKEQEFMPWTPTMLKLIDDQLVEDDAEKQQAEDALDAEESSEPVVEEKLVPEEQMIAEVAESYQRGIDEGKAAIESELADKFLKLDKFIDGFTSVQGNLEDFHAPLVKLSLALANHLVRAELKLDGAVINELVRQSLSAIENSGEDSVVVYLAKEDFEHAENILSDTYPHVKFEVDDDLSLGSLRVVMDDTSIEDLIENRLDALSDQLFRPQQELNPDRQQLIDPEANTDGERIAGHEGNVSGTSDTVMSEPITSVDDEDDFKDESTIDDVSSLSELEESNIEIPATEDDVQSRSEEVDIDTGDNEV